MRALDAQLVRWIRRTRGPVPAAEHALEGTPARHPGIAAALRSVRALGVRTELRFVWSVDGSGVIEDDPRTVYIHRRMLDADGAPAGVLALSHRTAALDMASVVRHEIGHALYFLDARVGRTAAFARLYGPASRRYRVGAVADEVERRLTRHHGLANPRYHRCISLYAATHPYESFAEAVRIALATGGDRRRIAAWVRGHGLADVVDEQIRFAADWLRTYRRR